MPSKKPKEPQTIHCEKKAIYPGSFDPLTNGHINIIKRGLMVFEEIVVAVARNTTKKNLFTPQEKVDMINDVFGKEPKVSAVTFEGLLVDYCRSENIKVILRGLRTVSDFEFEFQVAQANKQMAPEVDTLFMMTESAYSHISSTILKEIIQLGGSARGMVPATIERRMRKKLLGRAKR